MALPSGSTKWWSDHPAHRTRDSKTFLGSAVSDKPHFVDRRTFVSGILTCADSPSAHSGSEIASILVQAWPERVPEVKAAIAELAGCEVHCHDTRGKIVVVVDAPNAGVVGSALNTIAMTRGVLSAALVFHAVDTAAALYTEDEP